MSAGAGKLSLVDDQIFVADRSVLEPAFKKLLRAGGVARLSRERGPRDVRRHPVMRHGPPGVIFWRGLRKPDVSGVPGELTTLRCPDDRVAIANLAARSVDQIGTAFHTGDHLVVEEILRLRMKRSIYRHCVANRNHIGGRIMEGEAELFLDAFRQTVPVSVVQMHIEWLQPAKHGEAYATRGDRADMHSLNVVRARNAIGDVPSALHDPLVRGNVVPHEAEYHHHHVFGDAD